MNQSFTLDNLSTLAESVDVEFKASQGRDGKGELPEDFWKSYSAMANGDGGVIWLGIQEKPRGTFRVAGLVNVERVRKSLWDNLHNRKQISVNLLTEQQVQPATIEGKTVLRVEVPRAARQVKPVHLGSNPFGGTYLRRHEGDYEADAETVRRMVAERVEDSRDDRVLKGFDFADLDMDTVAAYRNRFAAVKPGHVWADLSIPEFLGRIGAIGKNRDADSTGLRLAGLLMFGRAEVIVDALPHYMVDYQERPEARTERRWIDRLVPDGSWSGNVYDFFRRVYQKLTADLKVPFQLQDGQRVEDTPVHEALREALVNTLIHADFSGRVSVLVVKRPDMFGFRNPGLMRIPVAQAIAGGTSDCRNRRLQKMFQLVGYGDQAGSGMPTIYTNWTGHLGARFATLSQPERLAMVTVAVEGTLNHARLREISTDHPTDISKMLARLVREGFLLPDGIGRGMVYYLPWQVRQEVSLFDNRDSKSLTPELSTLPPELGALPPELSTLPPESLELSPSDGAPTALALNQLNEADIALLRQMALPVSARARTAPDLVQQTVLALCDGRYLGLRLLAELLNRRDEKDFRIRILNPLLMRGTLLPAYPKANDPRQAYTRHRDENLQSKSEVDTKG
jgi:ATP-dependent DNA helicase RecG